jgi:antitoxin component YwqK of YwqJK toxin-antitoxin module
MAVKDGVFRKKIGIYCPGCNRIIKTYNKEGEVEEILDCDNCELEGEQFEYESKKLKKEEFYQFVTP